MLVTSRCIVQAYNNRWSISDRGGDGKTHRIFVQDISYRSNNICVPGYCINSQPSKCLISGLLQAPLQSWASESARGEWNALLHCEISFGNFFLWLLSIKHFNHTWDERWGRSVDCPPRIMRKINNAERQYWRALELRLWHNMRWWYIRTNNSSRYTRAAKQPNNEERFNNNGS